MSGDVARLRTQCLARTDGIKKLTGMATSAFKAMGHGWVSSNRVG